MTTPDKEQIKSDFNDQQNIYAKVTQKIIADLEKGELTWRKPWNSAGSLNQVTLPLRSNNIPYTGINKMLLWITAAEKSYQSPYWMTVRQANELNAHVRKGEKSTPVVYADKIIKEEQGEDGEMHKQQSSFLKVYSVFNADQVEGLPELFYKKIEPTNTNTNTETRLKEIDQFFADTKAEIYTGDRAAYYESTDKIEMPPFESFINATGYYGILSHEMTHWTKHEKRLNRDFKKGRNGDEVYAKEELVAELGACFLAAELGFEPIPSEVHAAYMQSWLKVLQHDNKFIFQAASQAQKAVEFMINLQPSKQPKVSCVAAEPKPIANANASF